MFKKKSKKIKVGGEKFEIKKVKPGAVSSISALVEEVKQEIEKESKGKINFSDDRTGNQLIQSEKGTKKRLYITGVTSDCPKNPMILAGIDFPAFVQPIDQGLRSRAGRSNLDRRPRVMKRTWLTRKQVKAILKAAANTYVDVSVPDEGKLNEFGQPTYYHDRIRSIYFLVLMEADPEVADPINPVPVVKRTGSVRKLLELHDEGLSQRSGNIVSTKTGTMRRKSIEDAINVKDTYRAAK